MFDAMIGLSLRISVTGPSKLNNSFLNDKFFTDHVNLSKECIGKGVWNEHWNFFGRNHKIPLLKTCRPEIIVKT